MSQTDNIYKTAAQIADDVLSAWIARIPDIATSPDSVIGIWSYVFSKVVEGNFLGMQLLHDDIFIQSASALALQRYGEQFGRLPKSGTLSTGNVRFEGAGGAFIAQGSQVGAPRPAIGDTLVFATTEDATVPDPGEPTAPTTADHGSGAALGAATYEHAITFTTAEGETEIGTASAPLVLANAHSIDLTAIAIGGDGTVGRKIYRRKNGGAWAFVHTIADNVTTIYTDATADGGLGGPPPDTSTAERITVPAQSTATGLDYNVSVGAITSIVDVEGDVSTVTNAAEFTGGSDGETTEEYRNNLGDWVANPQSGGPDDLIAWATSIDGVDSAAVFKNVDLAGDPALGTVVVRIAGPEGVVPDGDLVDEVQAYLESKDLANITILVGTFTPLTVPVDVTVTLLTGYSIDDVEQSVIDRATDYVNSVPVGGTVYVAGLYHAIFSLPGISTLVVNDPAVDTTADDDEKPVATDDDVTVGV